MINDYKISNKLNTPNFTINSFYNIISLLTSVIAAIIFSIKFDNTSNHFFIKSFIICLICMIIFKRSIQRKRPYQKYKNINNNDIMPTNGFYSFPSSHVMSSIIISCLLSYHYNLPFIHLYLFLLSYLE